MFPTSFSLANRGSDTTDRQPIRREKPILFAVRGSARISSMTTISFESTASAVMPSPRSCDLFSSASSSAVSPFWAANTSLLVIGSRRRMKAELGAKSSMTFASAASNTVSRSSERLTAWEMAWMARKAYSVFLRSVTGMTISSAETTAPSSFLIGRAMISDHTRLPWRSRPICSCLTSPAPAAKTFRTPQCSHISLRLLYVR